MDQYNYLTHPEEFPFATAVATIAQRVDLDGKLHEQGTIDFALLFLNILRHQSDITNLFGERLIDLSTRDKP